MCYSCIILHSFGRLCGYFTVEVRVVSEHVRVRIANHIIPRHDGNFCTMETTVNQSKPYE